MGIRVSMMDGKNEGELLMMNMVECEVISGGVIRWVWLWIQLWVW